MAEKRLDYLKKRLERDPELHAKYKATMEKYIAKGHAKMIQVKETDTSDELLSKKPILAPSPCNPPAKARKG